MIKFILESYSFRRIVILTVLSVLLLFAASKIFDLTWGSSSSIPIVNLGDVYSAPVQYDNFNRINLKLVSKDFIAIEGNKKFKLKDHQTGYDFYDTIKVFYPDTSFDKTNKLFLQFEDSGNFDSVYIVIAKSQENQIYYKQIFYSSVIIDKLNKFSDDPDVFRIDSKKLISKDLLNDNDTQINKVLSYFNSNMDNLGIAECGRNCTVFQEICSNFGVPCRLVNLQGGDVDQVGYYNFIGYPLHVVCEVYSSKHRKWYVIDPTYGFRFRYKAFLDYLSAVEISNTYSFRREDEIEQDSILLTKRTLVGRDYFKYYENVLYSKPEWKNKYLRKLVSIFYGNFNYYLYLYSNNFPIVKNGIYYVGIKTIMYFFMLILYINAVLFLLMRRLFLVKKPKNEFKQKNI